MTQSKFGSAGVTAREIDLSGPQTVEPSGVPAGIIGTANKGPAFVPVTVGIDKDFYAKFGKSDGKKFGPLAAVEWLRNAGAATYMRVLGVGDGKKRLADGNTAGSVNEAGFTVGENQPDPVTGLLVRNPYANSGGPAGRTYFLGCFMSESAGSDYFSSAGFQGVGGINPIISGALPVVRAVLMAASGVIVRLSSSYVPSGAPASSYVAADGGTKGAPLGDVVLLDGTRAKQEFVMLLNGHIGADASYPNVITASFDMTSPNYFANVFNKDPLKLQETGHYLYAQYDVHPAVAAITGSSVITQSMGAGSPNGAKSGAEAIAFAVTGSSAYNVGTSTVPNFENFNNRFSNARTPWIVSQKFGGNASDLFRLHSIDAGAGLSERLKFSVENITVSTDPANKYGSFDLVIRDILDRDDDPVIVEAYRGVSLDPGSQRYIAKVIGDLHVYFEFDKVEASQKIVVDGNYPNNSNYVRVEVASDVENAEVDPTAMPMGFRGPAHLVTSGTNPLAHVTSSLFLTVGALKRTTQIPVPLRQNITVGSGNKQAVNSSYYWGVQFEHVSVLSTPNASTVPNKTINGYAKYFPDFMTTTQNVVAADNYGAADTAANGVIDADRFSNNFFTLENVQVVTNSSGLASPTSWVSAQYVRNGSITADVTAKTRALTVSDITQPNKKFCKFSFFMQGGFDGVNTFNTDEAQLNNNAVTADMNDANRGLNNGPNVKAYIKAIDIMKSLTEADIQILAVPGIRHPAVTDAAALAVKNRFDALYIMDIEEYDASGNTITSSLQLPHVGNTVTEFNNRAYDNSFAAAYYPDVVVTDPNTNTNVVVPPSVVVLGALALNDRVGFPWFAPAGFQRGALQTALEASVKLYKDNMDSLYDANINPLVSFPGQQPLGAASGGLMVWGQKTLQAAASALDRVNVRRLLIALRREVRDVSNTIIFEPNRETTLTRFSDAIRPRLERIQSQRGVDAFLVKIDTTTTTQLDVEQNTIRGKIYVVPTKTVEFVSIDFVVTNTGQNGI